MINYFNFNELSIDLPIEIINKIYSYDDRYYNEYNKSIEIINKFPQFIYSKYYENYFTKYFYNIYIEQTFCVKALNYKKSLLVAAKYFVNDKKLLR